LSKISKLVGIAVMVSCVMLWVWTGLVDPPFIQIDTRYRPPWHVARLLSDAVLLVLAVAGYALWRWGKRSS